MARTKTWQDLTDPERIRDLRRDVEKLFRAARNVDKEITVLRQNTTRFETKVSEAIKKIERKLMPSTKRG